MAYCGGILEDMNYVACGFSPLIIGDNEVCPKCSKLICKKCYYCSKNCYRIFDRRGNRIDKVVPDDDYSIGNNSPSVKGHTETIFNPNDYKDYL